MSEAPLFDVAPLVQVPPPPVHDRPLRSSDLTLHKVRPATARRYVAAWHSRLPATQQGPWKLAFVAEHGSHIYGAALWHNPSSRMLPNDWLELRRLAVPEYAPHCAASWMLGAMRRWVAREMPSVPRLISYQDTEVHDGTIYKAAGWTLAYSPRAIRRNRSELRDGRLYRSDINGAAAGQSVKNRWEINP